MIYMFHVLVMLRAVLPGKIVIQAELVVSISHRSLSSQASCYACLIIEMYTLFLQTSVVGYVSANSEVSSVISSILKSFVTHWWPPNR